MIIAAQSADKDNARILEFPRFESSVADLDYDHPYLGGRSCILEFQIDDEVSIKFSRSVAIFIDWNEIEESANL